MELFKMDKREFRLKISCGARENGKRVTTVTVSASCISLSATSDSGRKTPLSPCHCCRTNSSSLWFYLQRSHKQTSESLCLRNYAQSSQSVVASLCFPMNPELLRCLQRLKASAVLSTLDLQFCFPNRGTIFAATWKSWTSNHFIVKVREV